MLMSSPATPIRVLAIDDDDDIQAPPQEAALRRTGFVLTSAMDGEEALDWLNRAPSCISCSI